MTLMSQLHPSKTVLHEEKQPRKVKNLTNHGEKRKGITIENLKKEKSDGHAKAEQCQAQ